MGPKGSKEEAPQVKSSIDSIESENPYNRDKNVEAFSATSKKEFYIIYLFQFLLIYTLGLLIFWKHRRKR